MQDLDLGETLDDGVTIGTYSEALEKVGVNVLDANGNLRSMDNILEDLGEKWKGLSEGQQVALAETVAGVRQYSQFLALMNSWDEVKENIDLATNSTGELNAQQNKYLNGVEASEQRLQEAKDLLSEAFISDNMIVGWNDVWTDILKGISEVVNGLGGIGPIILTLVGMFSRTLFPIIQTGFHQLSGVIGRWTGKTYNDVASMQDKIRASLQEGLEDSSLTEAGKKQIQIMSELMMAKEKLMLASKNMSEADKLVAKNKMILIEQIAEETLKVLELRDALEKDTSKKEKDLLGDVPPSMKNKAATRAVNSGEVEVEFTDAKGEVRSVTPQGKVQTDELQAARTMSKNDIQQKMKDLQLLKELTNPEQAPHAGDTVAGLELQIEERDNFFSGIDRKDRKMVEKAGSIHVGDDKRGAEVPHIKDFDHAAENVLDHRKEKSNLDFLITQEDLKDLDAAIKKLERIAALQKVLDEQTTKGAVVSKIEFGGKDQLEENADLGKDKATKEQMDYLQGTVQDIGGTMDDQGNGSLGTSFENYEKLYGAIEKNNVIKAKLIGTTEDLETAEKKLQKMQNKSNTLQDKMVKSEEKLTKSDKALIAQMKNKPKILNKTSVAYQSLSKEGREYADALIESNDIQKKLPAAQQATVNSLKSNSQAYIDLAKDAGASTDQITALEDAFNNVNTGNLTDTIETIDTVFTDLGQNVDFADANLEKMAGDMEQSLINNGAPEEKVRALTENYKEMANTAPQVETGMTNLNEALQDGEIPMQKQGANLQTISGGLMQTFGASMQLVNSIQSLSAAFGEGGTTMQKFSSIVSLAMAAVSLFNGVNQMTNGVLGQQVKQLAVTGIAMAKDTVKTWLNTHAKIANLLSNPFTMGLAIAAVAAIAVVGVALLANTTDITENTGAKIENSKATLEAAEAWVESVDAMDNAIASYKRLNEAQKDTAASIQDIVDAIPDLVDGYRQVADEMIGLSDADKELLNSNSDEIERLGTLLEMETDPEKQAELVDQINELTNQNDAVVATEAQTAAEKGRNAAMKQAATAAGGESFRLGTASVFYGYGSEEEEAADILKKYYGQDDEIGNGDNYADVTLRTDSAEHFEEDYKRLLAAKQEMEEEMSAEDLDDSLVYEELCEVLNDTSEAYEEFLDLNEEANKYNVYKAVSDLSSTEGMDVTDISSIEEYMKYREKLLATAKGDPAAEQAALDWLESQSALEDYTKIYDRLAATGLDNNKKIVSMIDNLSDDEKELLLSVNFNTVYNEESLQRQLDHLQSIANQEKLTVKIDTLTDIKDKLSDEMTKEDWDEIKAAYNWGEDGVMDFSDFVKMSRSEQEEYLDNELEKSTEERMKEANADVANMEESIAAQEADKQKAKMEVKQAENEISRLSDLADSLDENTSMTDDQKAEQLRNINMAIAQQQEIKQNYQNIINKANEYTEEDLEEARANQAVYAALMEQEAMAEYKAATSLVELQSMFDEFGKDYSGTYEYSQALIDLAEEFDNTTAEIEAYKLALESGDEAAIQAAGDALEAAILIGEAAETYGLDADVLETEAKAMAEAYGISKKAATQLAISNERMNKGIEALSENWSDWKEDLKKGMKDPSNYAKSVTELTKAIADLVNASEDLDLSSAFFESEENLELIEQAANGSTKAVEELGLAVASDVIKSADLTGGRYTSSVTGIYSDDKGQRGLRTWATEWMSYEDILLDGIANLQENLDSLSLGDNVYDQLGGNNWVAALNQMAIQTQMSVDDMNSLLSTMGLEANVDVTEKEFDTRVPKYRTYMESGTELDANGNETAYQDSYTTVVGFEDVKEVKQIAQISYGDDGPSPITYTSHGTASTPTSSGSGSSKGTAKKGKKSDKVERYKEVTDKIDNVTRATDRASTAADRLYGQNRIDKMKEVNALLTEEVGLLNQKRVEAEGYLEEDYNALLDAASKAGVELTFNAEGDISNYTEAMTSLWEQLDALYDSANADGEVSDDEQEAIDDLEELIDDLSDAISTYDETKELLQDIDQEVIDKLNEIQDNNQSMWKDGLDVRISEKDLLIEGLDYAINKYSEDFELMVTAFEFMGQKITDMFSNTTYFDAFNELQELWANGDISEADYMEDLQEIYSSALSSATELYDLDKEMMEYYETTLSLASDELAKYTDQMENLASVLDHYRSIVELVNGEYDYKTIGKVLDGQSKVLQNQMEVATNNYQMLLAQKQAIEERLANATTEAEKEVYQKQLDSIVTAVDEAQEEMLSKTEEWAEVQKEILENAMSEAAQEMEKAFTNGLGFDNLSNSMDRLTTYTDEYLTKTNQLYETQKLMRTAQQAIDKTTNEAAKARLKAYNDEIAQLRDKNKLSNLELEIAKAKYDIVLAEIALEEAQNAKSTVRLQRDSEGNFGYVYTANQDAISNAEQQLADAQNALYNIALDGANDYGQRIIELNQQLADDLIALEEARNEGQFATEEEYQAAKKALLEDYYKLYTAYNEQYTIALGTDADAAQDAWIRAYDEIIKTAGNWENYASTYIEKVDTAYQNYVSTVEENANISQIIDNVAEAIESVVTASDKLKESADAVIEQTGSELEALQTKIDGYANLRQSILDAAASYEDLAKKAYAAWDAIAHPQETEEPKEEPAPVNSGSGSNNSGSGSNNSGSGSNGGTPETVPPVDTDVECPTSPDGKHQGITKTEPKNCYHLSYNYQECAFCGKLLNAPYVYGGDYHKWEKKEDSYYTWYECTVCGEIKDRKNKTNTGAGPHWAHYVMQYDTGGYTGEWGPEGRLALLHQKELVLNADDTKNFLSMAEQMRDIAKAIDLRALQSQFDYLNQIPTILYGDAQSLEQTVHIEANFPAVQDRHEIEEAFTNLINVASQYANRK